ncbi:MAG: guanylate kinase [Spirochaetes bacterium]|nr:guanylate kinase [Spirochaetota bacterium]
MKSSKLSVVISAPSGAGKTTLIKRLLSADDRFVFLVSTTTRSMREGETPGTSYTFVSEGEFREMIEKGAFLEWAMVHGNYYGTPKKEIDRIQHAGKIPIFDVDVQGARTLRGKLDGAVYVFIVPPSREALETRLRNRKTDADAQIRIRLRNAIRELKEYGLYDYIVVNDDLETALEHIRSIVTAESCRRERVSHIITGILEERGDNSD